MRKSILVKTTPLIITAIVLLLAACLIYFIHQFIIDANKSTKPKVAQQITLIAPPPPPPPPPPPEQPPEPKPVEEVVEKMPEPTPDAPAEEPAGEDLGVDAEGGAGTDGFGLVGHKGGTGLGIGRTGHYEAMVKEKLIDLIYADEELKYLAYSGVIKVWINGAGEVEKYSVSLEEDSPKIEKMLSSLLKNLKFNSGPPLETADKAIKLRIKSKV